MQGLYFSENSKRKPVGFDMKCRSASPCQHLQACGQADWGPPLSLSYSDACGSSYPEPLGRAPEVLESLSAMGLPSLSFSL